MATGIQTFSPDLIHNFDRLKTLFSGEKELAEIDQLPEEALVRSKDFSYFNRWQVAWIIVTFPFTSIISVFLLYATVICSLLCLRSLSNRLSLLSTHFGRNFEYLIHQISYGSSLWVPSLNYAELSSSDVYTQSSIKREEILDKKIQKKLNHKEVDYAVSGLCRGGAHWFNYLFLKKLKKNGSDIETVQKCAVGVAKQFEKGQPRQASLLQAMWGLETDLLDTTSRRELYVYGKDDYFFSGILGQILHFFLKLFGLIPEDKTLSKEITNLKDGVYYVSIRNSTIGHAVSLIKCAEEVFIWDSNKGLIPIRKPNDLSDFFSSYYALVGGETVNISSHKLKEGFFTQGIKLLDPRNLFHRVSYIGRKEIEHGN